MPTAVPAREEPQAPDRERLKNKESPGLNGRGSRPRGYVCSRHWHVYSQKPAKVSQAAWEKLSPHTRKQHRLAIEDLVNTPHDLLALDLAAAATRLIHRAAKMRKWKASTIVSKFATTHGALMHPPLYTDQPHPISLKESPEWTSAYGRWHQIISSEVPNPPPHVVKTQIDDAARHLQDDPEARLFLQMMWSFAARPGVIGGLRPTDVTLQTPTAVSYPVGLTHRRGKATHFRGPYPVASHLSRQDGSCVAHQMAQRTSEQSLFRPPAAAKKKARAALKRVNPALELASIRKGAVHHLARAGAPEAEIMRLTGHTSLTTLRRYLNYSQQPTREAIPAQDSASTLLHDPTPLATNDQCGTR
ncbi:TATE DNA transposon [Leptomonas pyrrhocoris]|uniref:TATE DNA transposon n=1 Tax=Leptomonas pyrrhocoris TaxID=157538 RepID=A0A0N0VH16_LEPPY|nr:TATE DNA transposon [Leptomonas pyrrhocoris]XP_015662913.1 TATE DNA transposon [Leptomonas pyrrhocoris]KPA83544.1 TATE DNA transposon [Leptomonas pyrrhocoris]KPA84474.1 TATE DNA transposon [Leptomonas pyrrhocoris]|eukprot:XP_015661983.1 TATE DNA transposon [Leptomonas pyrrhocoris]